MDGESGRKENTFLHELFFYFIAFYFRKITVKKECNQTDRLRPFSFLLHFREKYMVELKHFLESK